MELRGDMQKTINKEIAGTIGAGTEVAATFAHGILEKFSGTREVAGEMLTYRLSKMFLGTRMRMR